MKRVISRVNALAGYGLAVLIIGLAVALVAQGGSR